MHNPMNLYKLSIQIIKTSDIFLAMKVTKNIVIEDEKLLRYFHKEGKHSFCNLTIVKTHIGNLLKV